MRRTRHVVLPVRSWQYIGLLIVSLACLTLGLVSRDREGHAGSLAGPELTHQAPHEVDACPNLNAFVKSPIAEPEEATKPINDHGMKVYESRASPTSRKSLLSRSLSLDRASGSGSRNIRERLSENRDPRTVERLSRSRTRVSDDGSVYRFRESRFRTTVPQSRDSSFDPATRLSRSRDLSNGENRSARQNFQRRLADPASSRLEDRRSRSTERRELNEIAQRQSRADRRDSLNLQRRTSDHRDRSFPLTERRVDRRESRDVLASRREYRDLSRNRVPNHRSAIRERRSVERRVSIERRDAERSDRREDRRDLLNRSARFARTDTDRNSNLDRRNRERSLENRRALHDRAANQERRSRFSVARDSRGDLIRSDDRRTLSRSLERAGVNDLNRKTLSRRVRSVQVNTERSEDRGSSIRSMERREIGHGERREVENRLAGRTSLDRATSRASSEGLRRERLDRSQSRRDSRESAAVRDNHRVARSRYDVEEIASRERRERFARSSRSVDRNSVDRRETARIRDSRNHDRRSREERRVVLQKPREAERRLSEERVAERRVLERRVSLDSRPDARRSSERRIDSAKSREGSRLADRRLERDAESRISRGRTLEKRSILDARSSSERRVVPQKSREVERRLAEQRLPERRVLERRVALNSHQKSREPERRLAEQRFPERRILERRVSLDSRLDARRSSERMQDRRVERNSELRNSISVLSMERSANSRAAALENQVLRSSKTQREIRHLKERRVARSVEARPTEFRERESARHLRQRSARNIEDSSRLSSPRRVAHVPEQNRVQRRLSAERMLARTVDNERLSTKRERNLQDARVERKMEIKTKVAPISMKDYEFFKYPIAYDLMRQAFVVALCTVYGLSLYNGKQSSLGNNIMQNAQRFIIW
ncbi:PREDICTED: biorientation of chromosomes in cell division protein 1-like 1 [Vollenhovia emeryi]|uniref:biorientation of chromosomes in cell division protein 1-like 1 n=1 Tax=Vollenhovia emeryi TaxID=411798 RepID=UPI0005F3C3F7|nr:PREDICTED: biorientation of chromosomes in cell division protein 1-like 1 [Vollenhovia emeryi]